MSQNSLHGKIECLSNVCELSVQVLSHVESCLFLFDEVEMSSAVQSHVMFVVQYVSVHAFVIVFTLSDRNICL